MNYIWYVLGKSLSKFDLHELGRVTAAREGPLGHLHSYESLSKFDLHELGRVTAAREGPLGHLNKGAPRLELIEPIAQRDAWYSHRRLGHRNPGVRR